MPESTQPVAQSYSSPIPRGRVSLQITQTNQGVSGITITGALQLDPQKYAAGKGIIECLDLSSLPTPNLPDPDTLLPLYNS